MEGALVTAAAGALKPVLGKLATLLGDEFGDEYKRFRRVREDIGFLTRELTAMEAFLLKMSTQEDPDLQDKVWMNEVRDLSYDIEDSLDDFMENAADKSAKTGGFMKKIKNFLDRTKTHRQIAKAIEGLKKQVIETSERHKRYSTSEAIAKVNNVNVDPRALAIFEDVSNLVGIDGEQDKLTCLFTEPFRRKRHPNRPKMISIVGSGGLGKTTLAWQVYKELKDQYDCHAFVSVSRNPDIMKVLRNIIKQVVSNSKNIPNQVSARDYSSTEDLQQLITQIKNFLADKRYFIVLDDIWNVEIWNVIKFAFPSIGYGCGILTTTRMNDVSEACSSSSDYIYPMKCLSMVHSKILFNKRLFNSEECPQHLEEVSRKILVKCGGLPLAIIAISGLLANKEKTMDQWHQVESSIGRGLEKNPSIEGMIKIISLSYFELPHHLKTCLLYLSIFPEDYIIKKEMLIRRWIAEGFIQGKHGHTPYEAGEMCFNELINRRLIQPDFWENTFDELSYCLVHDTVLEFIISKSIEQNFVTIIGIPGKNPDQQNKVRRLSLQNNGEIPAGLSLSAVRSLNIFGRDVKIPSLLAFKHLRVLCFEDCMHMEDRHLAGIGNLIYLKCLRLDQVSITEIPEEIVKLQYLETLDIWNTSKEDVKFPATISPDGRLIHLVAVGCKIPDELEGMKSLEVFELSSEHQSTDFFGRLGDLTNLKKLRLNLRYYEYYEAEIELASSIRKLVKESLHSLAIELDGPPNSLVEELNLPAECTLQELHLYGMPISRVPRWMGSLLNLQKLHFYVSCISQEDLEMVAGIPSLCYISIHYRGPSGDKFKAAMDILIAAHPNYPVLEWYWSR